MAIPRQMGNRFTGIRLPLDRPFAAVGPWTKLVPDRPRIDSEPTLNRRCTVGPTFLWTCMGPGHTGLASEGGGVQ